ncbi:MAG: HTH domain-containing protein [Chloroflexi bacterium]|nr:HTH domain-containing protein [Chloroflexota bacterium]
MITMRDVAIAILLLNGRYIHYNELAKLVVESGLSDLGRRGRTPGQTLKTVMLKDSETFDGGHGHGCYSLADPKKLRENPPISLIQNLMLSPVANDLIERALGNAAMVKKCSEQISDADMIDHLTQNRDKLKTQNAELLAEVAKLRQCIESVKVALATN